MPIQCSVVSNHSHARKPGDMWQSEDQHNKGHWLVLLPGGCVHDINGPSKDGTFWTVTGNAPNFTVTPSINVQIVEGDFENFQGWHGWLQDGFLSDDCEGRTYPTKEV